MIFEYQTFHAFDFSFNSDFRGTHFSEILETASQSDLERSAVWCCPGKSHRSIESLDCFGSSHFSGCNGMKTLVLHACADGQGYILHSTCDYCCLIQFDISCKTLTWEGLSWGGGWGGEMACLNSALCYYGKWPENQTLSFQNRCNWKCESLYTSRVIEKPLQTGSIFCSP